MFSHLFIFIFFFFNDTATTEIYTLSLHDALPIYRPAFGMMHSHDRAHVPEQHDLLPSHPDHLARDVLGRIGGQEGRSEEHTSELQSQSNLVCRLLLEKKKNHHHHDDVAPICDLMR